MEAPSGELFLQEFVVEFLGKFCTRLSGSEKIFSRIGIIRNHGSHTGEECLLTPPILLVAAHADNLEDNVEIRRVKVKFARSKTVQREGKRDASRLNPRFRLSN